MYHIEWHSIIFFSIASYCTESPCVESNRNRISLHHNRGKSYRITSYWYLLHMYCIIDYASRCMSYRPQLWRCISPLIIYIILHLAFFFLLYHAPLPTSFLIKYPVSNPIMKVRWVHADFYFEECFNQYRPYNDSQCLKQ